MNINFNTDRTSYKRNGFFFRRPLSSAIALTLSPLMMWQASSKVLAADDNSFMELEEVVITARKRNESLLEISDSVVVMTDEKITDAGIDSVEDVSLLVPNFSFVNTQNPGTVFINMRGIGQFRNAEPPVAIVVDGVQLTSTDAISQELYDVQQIEVLKGPQGAFFGRNAPAGAINITTKAPSEESEGSIEVKLGNGSYQYLRGLVSGSLGDETYARLSGSISDYDGLLGNITLHEKVDFAQDKNLRLRIISDLTDTVALDFRASYSELNSGSSYFTPIVDENNRTLDGATEVFSDIQGDIFGESDRELSELALKIDADLGFATFTSISSYTDTNESFSQDIDFSVAPILDFSQARSVKAWSEEVRLNSNDGGDWQWQIGAYYLSSERTIRTSLRGNLANVLTWQNAWNPSFGGEHNPLVGFSEFEGAGYDLNPANAFDTLEESNAYAVFGNLSYDLNESWSLTAALRYDVDERDFYDVLGTKNAIGSEKFSEAQPKFQVSYQPADSINIYGSWGVGFRSGGFNQVLNVTRSYPAEVVETIEFGFKSKLSDNAISLNAALFYTEIEDRQDFTFIAGAQTIFTFPTAELYGLEIELQSQVTDSWEIFASVGFIESEITSEPVRPEADNRSFAELTKLDGNSDFGGFKGNDIPLTYGWSTSIGAQYVTALPSLDAELKVRIDYSGRGDMKWEAHNLDEQEDIHLLNLRASLDFNNYYISFWAENLTDEDYWQEFVSNEFTALNTDLGFKAQPRRVGLTAGLRF